MEWIIWRRISFFVFYFPITYISTTCPFFYIMSPGILCFHFCWRNRSPRNPCGKTWPKPDRSIRVHVLYIPSIYVSDFSGHDWCFNFYVTPSHNLTWAWLHIGARGLKHFANSINFSHTGCNRHLDACAVASFERLYKTMYDLWREGGWERGRDGRERGRDDTERKERDRGETAS